MGIIYKHTNKNDGSIYIGYSTYSMEERWKEHLRDSHCVNHKSYNTHFYNAIRKYGPDAFEHEVLEECSDDLEVLYEREKYWIAFYNTYQDREHYNLTPGGDGRASGYYVSEETRQKMSEAQKGKVISEETRQKISEGNRGKILSEETCQRISEAKKGNNNWLGKTHSEESRKKISESLKGKAHSEESRKKISESLKGNKRSLGRILSEETRKKMSESRKGENNPNFGKTHSEETRKKISESLKDKKHMKGY